MNLVEHAGSMLAVLVLPRHHLVVVEGENLLHHATTSEYQLMNALIRFCSGPNDFMLTPCALENLMTQCPVISCCGIMTDITLYGFSGYMMTCMLLMQLAN